MPDLSFTVEKAIAEPFAAAPTISFELRIANADPGEQIHSAIIRCQFQIEATRRQYSAKDQEQLRDLYGTPERWGQTLRNMLWTHASVVVPSFTASVLINVPVACTFDFNIAATKYFEGLSDGDIPLSLMFSGTVFYEDVSGFPKVAPVPWDKETRYRLPAAVWKEMMELYYPNSAWLCLRKDAFERLHQYKIRNGIPTWEEAIERLFAEAAEGLIAK